MTNLKTLKDLDLEVRFGTVHLRQQLKAEAVKWIKEDLENSYAYAQEIIIKNWMERFNITEEDLK